MTKNTKVIIICLAVIFVLYLCATFISPKFIDRRFSDSISGLSAPQVLYNNNFAFKPICPLVGGVFEKRMIGIGVERTFCRIDSKLVCVSRGGKYFAVGNEEFPDNSCVKK